MNKSLPLLTIPFVYGHSRDRPSLLIPYCGILWLAWIPSSLYTDVYICARTVCLCWSELSQPRTAKVIYEWSRTELFVLNCYFGNVTSLLGFGENTFRHIIKCELYGCQSCRPVTASRVARTPVRNVYLTKAYIYIYVCVCVRARVCVCACVCICIMYVDK